MRIITSLPKQFARQFNTLIPQSPFKLTAKDVVKLTTLSLIKRHTYYSPTEDVETIRAIFEFMDWIERTKLEENNVENQSRSPKLCKLCGEPLPPEPEGKKGRPREYCPECNPLRSKIRHKKWQSRRKAVFRQLNALAETNLVLPS